MHHRHQAVSNFSLKLCRPLFKDFYFAYVQFRQQEHADKVLADYRYPIIKGEQCRALPFNYKTRSAVAEKPKHKSEQPFTVFVKNCPKDWTHEDLYEHFKQYGKVLSAKMSIDANFTTRGYAFVTYEGAKAGQKAIAESDGLSHSKLDDAWDAEQTLLVSEYLQKQDRQGSTTQKCSTNLYVKNFPAKDSGEFAEEDLRALFAEFGDIASVVVMRDDTNKSKGFGFVCFKDWQDAHKALTAFEEARASHTSTLYVAEFKSKEQRQKELQKKTYQFKKSMQKLSLIVKNVDGSATEEQIREFFS